MPSPNSEIQADILKACWQLAEMASGYDAKTMAEFLGRREEEVARAMADLRQMEMVTNDGKLTESGRRHALALARAHRLLEAYLRTQKGVPIEQVHRQAERMEHDLSPLDVEKIAALLGHPRFDPHGDPIPTRSGHIPCIARTPLLGWPPGIEGRIVHIEDEPEKDSHAIFGLGITCGARFRTGDASTLWVHGKTVTLPMELRKMISVEPLAEGDAPGMDSRPLSEFPENCPALILELDPRCTGAARHRLLDLGLVPGTPIEPDFEAPFGGPRTYRVRGTHIALRREQSEGILARPIPPLE